MPIIRGVYDDDDDQTPSSKSDSKKDKGGKTALIPKELCPDMEVGDKVILRIVGEHEKDWMVDYPGDKDSDSDEDETENEVAPVDSGDGGMYD